MKAPSLRLALSAAAVLPLVLSLPAQAKDASKHSVAAKIQYCKDCHGLQGQGFLGAYPVPRIAGQTFDYLKAKSKVIMQHKRYNPTDTLMAPALESTKPEIREEVYEYFTKLDPLPAAPGPKALAAAGKKIYEKGVSEDNLPPCLDCHGKAGKGEGKYPRLAGQIYPYIVKVLTQWRTINKDRKRGRIVKKGAHNTSPSQIKALAAYISNMR